LGHALTGPVECYSGSHYAERPLAFSWEGQRHEVAAIEAEWRTPDGRCFQVRTREDLRFLLAYNESSDEWQITRC
jgi:hypothetical protein